MRLLHIDSDGELRLTKDYFEQISPYAILLHTWVGDHDRLHITVCERAREEVKLAIPKSGSAVTKPERMNWNTFGSTRAALTKLAMSGSPK
jgi:hypothetical protein